MRVRLLPIICCSAWLVAAAADAEIAAYWPFDEDAGLLALDRGPGGNDALLHNVERVAGRTGGGLRFGGADSDSYLTIPDSREILPEAGFTVQFWWEKTESQVQILFRKGRSGNRCTAYAYLEGDLHFQLVDREGQQFGLTAPAPADGWHHLAFTTGGPEMAIIIDGEVVASGPRPTYLYRDDAPLIVGTYSPGYRWCLAGTIDDLCVSYQGLDPQEIAAELERARALQAPATRLQHFEPETGGVVLARDGVPGASIVIAEDASPLQLEPALDLRRVVQRMTGARLPLVYDADATDGPVVLVGESRLTREMDLPTDLSGDEFVIHAQGDRLVLLGHDALLGDEPAAATDPSRSKRGTANAVHAFLADQCGVRWYMPGRLGEVVPERASLEIAPCEIREQPQRTYSLGSMSRDDWARRQLIGSSVFIRHRGGHLWYSLIPEQEYFDEHPEWFALLDGARRREGNHLCTTNPEMRAEALARLRAIFDQGYEWVELGQTDGYRRCRCEECEALDEYRVDGWWVPGVPADRIHLFHDWLAREVGQSHPGRTVLIIAYGPTGEVPQAIEHFGGNVAVEFTHNPQWLIDRWVGWHDRFTAYVYWWGLYQKLGFGPKSSPQHVADEVRRMRDAGVEAFYLCGGGECWSTEAPGYYVYSRLQRDPTLDADALVDEFCDGLFGAAAGAMREYFDTLYEAAERYRALGAGTPVVGEPWIGQPRELSEIYAECFPATWGENCSRLLARAEEQAAAEGAVLERIAFFRDGLEYLRHTAACLVSHERWLADRSDANLEAHRALMAEREAFVDAMLARQAARGADLPPVFGAGRDLLLRGPRDIYADLYAPLEADE